MFGLNFFRRKRKTGDFKTEIEAHLQFEAERLREQGLSEEDARAAAHRAFGNVTKAQESFYESRHWLFWDNLWRDLRYSSHLLRKSPSFTLAAILTLAMAIGANVVVFSVLNALILRPLNLPHEQSLYFVERAADRSGNQSYPDYIDLRDRNRSFEGLAAFNIAGVGLGMGQNPSLAWGWEVSGNYFDVLGIHPYLGRFFHAADEHGANSAPYIVLAYAYWHNYFRDDPGVIGRTVQLNKHPFTIIGVAPSDFYGTSPGVTAEFYAPIVDQEQIEGSNHLNARGVRSVQSIIGHLKPEVTPAQALADLNSVGSYLEKTYPQSDKQMTFAIEHPSILGGGDLLIFVRAFIAGLILLAACANLGSLFAARAADRSREIAVRLALGSSRARVLRQLFTEAVLISLIGGAVGLWSSALLLGWLSQWHPLPRYPVQVAVSPDAYVYAFAFLLALLSGLLFGSVPVRQVLQTDPYGVIKSGSTAGRLGRQITARELLLAVLLAVQIALCALLVTSSFVAVRGLVRSMSSNLGVETRNAMLVDVDLNTAGYHGDQVAVMQKKMLDAMTTLPGVQSVGLVDLPPLTLDCCGSSQIFLGATVDLTPRNALTRAVMFKVSPEYFRAAGTAFLSGREFTWHDDKSAPRVAIVNRRFARLVFGSVTNALGRDYKIADGTRIQVVGIVEDGKYGGTTEAPKPTVFVPILQSPADEAWLIVRSRSDTQELAEAIRTKLSGLDPGLVSFLQTWDAALDTTLFGARMAAVSLGVLGVMGALLSITGIFGMAAYAVSRRKRDLGIRIALGAQRKEVLQAALGRAVKLLAFGSGAGLLLGILASRVLAFIVYEATPRDPLVLAGVVLAMALVGLVATWIPAQRALSIDPAMLLREE
jgi:predicted permease